MSSGKIYSSQTEVLISVHRSGSDNKKELSYNLRAEHCSRLYSRPTHSKAENIDLVEDGEGGTVSCGLDVNPMELDIVMCLPAVQYEETSSICVSFVPE